MVIVTHIFFVKKQIQTNKAPTNKGKSPYVWRRCHITLRQAILAILALNNTMSTITYDL